MAPLSTLFDQNSKRTRVKLVDFALSLAWKLDDPGSRQPTFRRSGAVAKIVAQGLSQKTIAGFGEPSRGCGAGKNGGSAQILRKKAAGDQHPLRPTGKIECLICSTSSPVNRNAFRI
jgi:hypothetical protein